MMCYTTIDCLQLLLSLFPIWQRIQLNFIQYIVSHNTHIILYICHRGVKYIDLPTQKYTDDVPYIYGKYDEPYSIITFYKYLNNIVYYRAFTYLQFDVPYSFIKYSPISFYKYLQLNLCL